MAKTALGALHPGVRFPRQLRYKSRLLFHWRAADALLGHDPAAHLLKPVTGETPTFSRASAGGLTADSRGRVRQWAQGMPRIEMVDLDGDGMFETPGMLLESSRTNLILRSQELDNAAWSTFEASVTPNVDTAPDGTVTADRIVESAAAALAHFVFQGVTATANATYVFTCYIKVGTRVWVQLNIREGAAPSNALNAWFNASTGVVGTTTQGGTASGVTSKIQGPYTGGWYRCQISGAINNGATAVQGTVRLTTGDGVTTHNGDGVSYLSAWGAQFEDNVSFPSSYIPTTSASVARSADDSRYPIAFVPQALSVYVRLIERGNAQDTASSRNVLSIGVGSGAQAGLILLKESTPPGYRALWGVTSQVRSIATSTPSVHQGVELVAQLTADAKVRLLQSINGGGDTGGTQSAAGDALTATWGQLFIYLGQSSGLANRGVNLLRDVKVAVGILSMDQMRRLL